MMDASRFSLVKPTLDTLIHIDFEWWKTFDNNWRVHLLGCLCPEHQSVFTDAESGWIDQVDPKTAEVFTVDSLQHILMSHCARQPDFVTSHTTLVEAAFRTFLANGNTPLSINDLAEKIGKPSKIVLQTIAGPKIYKGIRPYHG